MFCYKLPRDISIQMFNEYNSRLIEIKYLLKFPYYNNIKTEIKTIELLLALSIFHKRIIANLDSANIFSTFIFNNSSADSIQIGSYELNHNERNRILAIIMNFKSLFEKYSISIEILKYTETKEFLKNIKKYKDFLESGEQLNTDGKSI